MCLIEKTIFYDSNKVDKILGQLGKSLKKRSEYCTDLLIQRLNNTKERQNKICLDNKFNRRLSYCLKKDDNNNSRNHHINSFNSSSNSNQIKSYSYTYKQNGDSSQTRNLDKFEIYPNQNNDYYEYENKRLIQILKEIYSIAQAHSQVLGNNCSINFFDNFFWQTFCFYLLNSSLSS
jgi:hypothetical protein